MFRAKIYPKKLIFYTDNIRASVTNCMPADGPGTRGDGAAGNFRERKRVY